MEDALSEINFFTPSYIYSISLGIFDDDEQAALIPSLVETADSDAAHSERIFSTPSCIDYILLWILEDYVKAAGNAVLVEISDVQAVLGVEPEYDEVSVTGL